MSITPPQSWVGNDVASWGLQWPFKVIDWHIYYTDLAKVVGAFKPKKKGIVLIGGTAVLASPFLVGYYMLEGQYDDITRLAQAYAVSGAVFGSSAYMFANYVNRNALK